MYFTMAENTKVFIPIIFLKKFTPTPVRKYFVCWTKFADDWANNRLGGRYCSTICIANYTVKMFYHELSESQSPTEY